MNFIRLRMPSILVIAAFAFIAVPSVTHAAVHAAGSVVKTPDGTIWFITPDNTRRPFTSGGAFQSYGFVSFGQVTDASAEDNALTQGDFIPPQDGTIFCATETKGSDVKGECSLITNGQKAAFVSSDVFNALGFSFKNAISGDSSFLVKTADIVSATEPHRAGVLINNNGTYELVQASGYLGIPDLPTFNSWGYSFSRGVPANAADKTLVQSGVMSSRQPGQLNPAQITVSSDETAVIQGYVIGYPDLPTVEISSPDDAAAVLALYNTLKPDSLLASYPYLTSKSVEMLNKTPQFVASLGAEDDSAIVTTSLYPSVKIYQGGQFALYTETSKQTATGYTKPASIVFLKENGVWKMDLIGTLKYQLKQEQAANPTQAFVSGTGTTDLSIESLDYNKTDPKVNDPSEAVIVEVQNNGQTTIQSFYVYVGVNGNDVFENLDTDPLTPGQSILIALPIAKYWALAGVKKDAGVYRTDVTVGFSPTSLDSNEDDNGYYFNTTFQQ